VVRQKTRSSFSYVKLTRSCPRGPSLGKTGLGPSLGKPDKSPRDLIDREKNRIIVSRAKNSRVLDEVVLKAPTSRPARSVHTSKYKLEPPDCCSGPAHTDQSSPCRDLQEVFVDRRSFLCQKFCTASRRTSSTHLFCGRRTAAEVVSLVVAFLRSHHAGTEQPRGATDRASPIGHVRRHGQLRWSFTPHEKPEGEDDATRSSPSCSPEPPWRARDSNAFLSMYCLIIFCYSYPATCSVGV
jgi:hypothetical protein